jgi:hypothetical protein
LPDPWSRRTFLFMLRGLARTLLVVFCATMVAQQTNLGSLVFGDECRDDCPEDANSHRCPLNCTSCACVGHGTPVSLASAAPPTIRAAVAGVPCDEPRAFPDPQPDTIFHVPRSIPA